MKSFLPFSNFLILFCLINLVSGTTTTKLNDEQMNDETSQIVTQIVITANETLTGSFNSSFNFTHFNSTEIQIENQLSNSSIYENEENISSPHENTEEVEPIIQPSNSQTNITSSNEQINMTLTSENLNDSQNNYATSEVDPTDDMPDVSEEKSPTNPVDNEFAGIDIENEDLGYDEAAETNEIFENRNESYGNDLNAGEIDSTNEVETMLKSSPILTEHGEKKVSQHVSSDPLSADATYVLVGGLIIIAITVIYSVYRYSIYQRAIKKVTQDPLTMEQASRLV